MNSILKTSEFINNSYEIEKELHEDEEDYIIDYDNFLNEHITKCFDDYLIRNPSTKLTFQNIRDYVNKLEQLNMHVDFEKPSLEEYFNKRLNFLLLMDFLISFDQNKQLQSSQQIFDFFVDFSHFYRFMSYLDVNAKFLEYIKYMLVLYLQSLTRVTIDNYFDHITWELDQFFKFEVVRELYQKYDKNLIAKQNIKKSFENNYKSVLAKESSKIDYTTEEYNYLDEYFEVFGCSGIERKYTMIKVPRDNNDSDEYDSNSDYDSDYDYDYDYKKVRQYHIDRNDLLYETYKEMFIHRTYQQSKQFLEDFESFLKTADITIKDFTKFEEFPNASEPYKPKVLNFIGEILTDYGSESECRQYFETAYELCHVNIIKHILNTKPSFKPSSLMRLKNDPTYKELNDIILKKYQLQYESAVTIYTFK